MKDTDISRVRRLLTKPSKTKEDLCSLHSILSKTSLNDSFFKLVNEKNRFLERTQEVCKDFRYQFLAKGDVVFKEGDLETDYLYFILTGKVGVFIKSAVRARQTEIRGGPLDHLGERKRSKLFTPKEKENMRAFLNKAIGDERTPASLDVRQKKNVINKSEKEVIFKTCPPEDGNPLPQIGSRSRKPEAELKGTDSRHDMEQLASKKLPRAKITANFFKKIKNFQFLGASDEQSSKLLALFERFLTNDKKEISEDAIRALEKLHGPLVSDVSAGSTFGEKAIETLRPRSATIVALTNLELIAISQSNFLTFIRESLRVKKQKMINFLIESFRCELKAHDHHFLYNSLTLIKVA